MGSKLFEGVQDLGKSGMCSGQLAVDCCKMVPQSDLNGVQWSWTMNMAKFIWEDLGQKVTCWKLSTCKGLFSAESPLKSTLPLVILYRYTRSVHAWDVLVDCTFALRVRDVTWAQWDRPGWWQPFKKPVLLNRMFYKIDSRGAIPDVVVPKYLLTLTSWRFDSDEAPILASDAH